MNSIKAAKIAKVAKVATGAALSLLVLGAQVSFADRYFDEGVKHYTKKDYRGSIPYFEQSLQVSPWDSNAYYYCALAYQQIGIWAKAKEKYETLIDKFPGTPAAANATEVMKKLDPNFAKRQAESDGGGGGGAASVNASKGVSTPQTDSLAGVSVSGPATSRVFVEHVNDRIVVPGSVNGRAVKWYLGGDSTTLSRKDLRAMGMSLPNGPAVREAGQSAAGWKITGQVKVGDIAQSNFPIHVNDTADHPLLGSDFFNKVSYTMDSGGNSMTVARKDSGGSGRAAAGYDVSFTKSGSDMMVNLQINGRSCSAVFDPSVSECVIPRRRAKEFGMDVAETNSTNMWRPDNPNGALRGDPGFGEEKKEAYGDGSVRIGPVNKPGLRFKLDDNARQVKVGSSAFGEWQYTIDSQANVIRFRR